MKFLDTYNSEVYTSTKWSGKKIKQNYTKES